MNLQDEYSVEHYYLLTDYTEIADETEKNFDLQYDETDIVKMKFHYHGKNIFLTS